ncbi:MAG: FliM/FliN family flagellar motor switch protein [Erythrobacter sp.]
MNLAQTFTPARAIAQHCKELTQRGPRPEERAQHLTAWRRDVAREVAQDMADLLSGTKLDASLSEPEMMTGEAVFERIGAVAANSLLRCGGADTPILLSFEIETAIALTDRSFGGSGELVPEVVTSLPRSACLLIEQASRIVALAIARVSAGGGATGEAAGDVIVRSESATRLKPFGPKSDCVLLTLDFGAADGTRWSAKVAMPADHLDTLLPGMETGAASARGAQPQSEAARAAFGSIPLPLEAVLAEFELSLGRLECLSPGDQIPLAIGREIPLRIGEQVVARGSLGTLEDCMALRLNSISAGAFASTGFNPPYSSQGATL